MSQRQSTFPPELGSGTPMYDGVLTKDISGFGKKGDKVQIRDIPLAVFRRVGQVNVVNFKDNGIMLSTKREVAKFVKKTETLMPDSELRQATIKLAHRKPALRPHLLPLLRKG